MIKATKDAVLELDTRRRIYNLVSDSPGLHFRELQRRLDIAYGTLQYHIEFLIKRKLVVQENGADYSRYFSANFKSMVERDIMSLLRQNTIRHILICLLENPRLHNKDLAGSLDLSPSTVSWHIGKLVKSGEVVKENNGNEIVYYISEPEIVTRLLITYKSSFVDTIVNRFVGLWDGECLRH